MCLIIQAPIGTSKNGNFFKKIVKEANSYNPDGGGFAIRRANGELMFSKGYFNFEDLWGDLTSLEPVLEDEVVIHLRIGNKGKITPELCHPFNISSEDKELNELTGVNPENGLIFHNGTFAGFKYADTVNVSDTYLFTKLYLGDKDILNFLHKKPEKFVKLTNSAINGSRLVIMSEGHPTVLIGNWYSEEGYNFSKNIRDDEYYQTPSDTIPNPKKRTAVSNYNYYSQGYNEYDDYYDMRYGTGINDEGRKHRTNSRVGNKGNKQSTNLLFPDSKSSKIDEKDNILHLPDNTSEKKRFKLLNNGRFLPKESGFIVPSALTPISTTISNKLDYFIYGSNLYYIYLGLVVPYNLKEVNEYNIDINSVTHEYVTVFCRDNDMYNSKAVIGGHYQITKVTEENLGIHALVHLSALMEDELEDLVISKCDLYENFIICPTEKYKFFLMDLSRIIEKLPQTEVTLKRLTNKILVALEEQAGIVEFANNMIASIDACTVYTMALEEFLEKFKTEVI